VVTTLLAEWQLTCNYFDGDWLNGPVPLFPVVRSVGWFDPKLVSARLGGIGSVGWVCGRELNVSISSWTAIVSMRSSIHYNFVS
jgi:hypothetical protein